MWISKKTISLLIVLLIIVSGGILIYLKSKRASMTRGPSEKTQEQNAVEVKKAQLQAKKQEFDSALKKIYEIDKDMDGLADTEEAKYGTSPTSSDTDGDGISDKVEITNYRTNPLKADTDGDGYNDGDEVRHYMNPNKSDKK